MHNMDDEFSQFRQLHLTALRDDFSATSVEALPSLPSGPGSIDCRAEEAPDKSVHPWDENVNSVVEPLDDLTLVFVSTRLLKMAHSG